MTVRVPTTLVRRLLDAELDIMPGNVLDGLLLELLSLRRLERHARAACVEVPDSYDDAQVLTAIRAELEQLAPLPEEP